MAKYTAADEYARVERNTRQLFARLYRASRTCEEHAEGSRERAYEAGYQDALRTMLSQILPGVTIEKLLEEVER